MRQFYKVLVTGAREGYPTSRLKDALDGIRMDLTTPMLLMHGDAPGVDTDADHWALDHGIQRVKVPANWRGEGKAAGPLRNQLMLDLVLPDITLAFPMPESRGTWDMVSRVWRRRDRLPLLIFRHDGQPTTFQWVESELLKRGL